MTIYHRLLLVCIIPIGVVLKLTYLLIEIAFVQTVIQTVANG